MRYDKWVEDRVRDVKKFLDWIEPKTNFVAYYLAKVLDVFAFITTLVLFVACMVFLSAPLVMVTIYFTTEHGIIQGIIAFVLGSGFMWILRREMRLAGEDREKAK